MVAVNTANQITDEAQIRIRKGLDIPISGAPRQVIQAGQDASSIALIVQDYPDLRPKLLVQQGERVRLGEPLVADRRDMRIVYTAPGSGTVAVINRSEKRSLQSIVLSLEEDDEQASFPSHAPDDLNRLSRETVIDILLQSGSWTAFRSRPFGHVPLPDTIPNAIFVTAIDTNPLAARPELIIAEHRDDFVHGLTVISRIANCRVYLCTAAGTDIPTCDEELITRVAFSGPHPAGLPGTHIHFLSPAGLGYEVWHIGYQDVIAIGRLFMTGRLWIERVVSLAGSMVRHPRLVRTRLGADLSELVEDELVPGPVRVISGSILSGRRAIHPVDYLGRYHVQVSVLGEPVRNIRSPRPFTAFGFSKPFSRRTFPFLTALNGERTAMVPVSAFERVMPLMILSAPLLRALVVGDTERALDLGCIELEEEDLALCAFVCPGKINYGTLLRRTLKQIEKGL